MNKNLKNKMKYIIDKFFESMRKNYTNEFPIIYNINEGDEQIKLFGYDFVENNKDICFLKINNEILYLSEYYNLYKKNKSKILKVILIGKNGKTKKIMTNMSFMFHECNSLSNLTDFSKWNTINITNMKGMFYDCNSLITLPDITKWNTINVSDMTDIYYKSNELTIIYNIKGNKPIKLFDYAFVEKNKDNCFLKINNKKIALCEYYHLEELNSKNLTVILVENNPKTNKIITNMSRMFYECESLLSLPDISKWNNSNVTHIKDMFYNCKSLLSLPIISKWDTSNVIDMSGKFYDCISLSFLPDISKWNTSNVTDMSGMFYNCESLSSLPDISKWNTRNVIDMTGIFWNCKSLNIFKRRINYYLINLFKKENNIFYNFDFY